MSALSPDAIERFMIETFADLQPKASWGETSFFLNPSGQFASGAYFATIKEKDGENDRASNLDREGVFRLNFGPGKQMFETMFGNPPERPRKGGIVEGPWDFTVLDQIMPHPVYGWMSWLCVLNPSKETFEQMKPLLDAAYSKAAKTIEKRIAQK